MLNLKNFRRPRLVALISVILGLQIINLSIDPVDPHPAYEDLSINEIESCVEFVLELVLKKTGAVQETDDQDHSTHKPVQPITLFAYRPLVFNQEVIMPADVKQNDFTDNAFANSLSQPVISPPPKG